MSKNIKLLYFILLVGFSLFIFLACKSKSESTETLSFSVSTEYDFIGLTQFEGEMHFCFLKKRFNPNLKIFNAKGVLTDSISLVEAEKILGEITCIYAMNKDSIYIYAINNNSFLVVNYKGLPLQQKEYTPLISDNKDNYYGLLPSYAYLPFMPDNSKSMSCATIAIGDPAHFEDVYNNVKEKGFFICRLHPFSQEEIDFGIRFSDVVEFSTLGDSVLPFSPYFYIVNVNSYSFMFSAYSRYIYKLSENLAVTETFKILNNQDTVVSANSLDRMKRENIDGMNQELLQYRAATFIRSIHYNPVSDNYLVIVKNGAIEGENWQNFPFKVLVYDSNFINKIKEVEINSYDYTPHKSFIMNGKLYMQKENQSHNTKDYEIIHI